MRTVENFIFLSPIESLAAKNIANMRKRKNALFKKQPVFYLFSKTLICFNRRICPNITLDIDFKDTKRRFNEIPDRLRMDSIR